jgi:hypothetical protein
LGGLRGIDAGKTHSDLLGVIADRDGVAVSYGLRWVPVLGLPAAANRFQLPLGISLCSHNSNERPDRAAARRRQELAATSVGGASDTLPSSGSDETAE